MDQRTPEHFIHELRRVRQERNYAMRQRDEEREAKEGNIRALNEAVVESNRLRSIIREAPHAEFCDPDEPVYPCTCFKSKL